ncbi:hypothetical protein ACLKA6_013530, partial [Drosophila palustris]
SCNGCLLVGASCSVENFAEYLNWLQLDFRYLHLCPFNTWGQGTRLSCRPVAR